MTAHPENDSTTPPTHGGPAESVRRALCDVHRVAGHADHHAHRMRWRAQGHGTPWFLGSLMVAFGVVFLLDNLGLVEARNVFRNLWPALVIAWGIAKVLMGRGAERLYGALAVGFGGLWLADRLLGWDINVVGLFWPVLLIALGLGMLVSPRRHALRFAQPSTPVGGPGLAAADPSSGSSPATGGHAEESASIREVAIMAGIERRNISQSFRGASLTAFMGHIELDLRDCRMSEDMAIVWVHAVMGQVELQIPPTWTVESHLSAVMGNLEDRSDRPIDSDPKRLVIEGMAFMGQVEIRN